MFLEDLYVSTPTFEVLQPLLITLRLFGLFPISYKKTGNLYRLKWSLIYGVYSYCLSVGLAIWTIIGLVIDMRKDPEHSLRMIDEKTKFVTSGDIMIVVIIVVFGAVTLHLKIKKFWKLMAILNQADNIIPFKNFKPCRKYSIIFVAIVISTLISILTFDLYTWSIHLKVRHISPIMYLRQYFSFYILYSIIIMMEVFYWHVIFLIKIRISLLNTFLAKVKEKAFSKKGNYLFEPVVGKVYLDKNNRKNTGRKTISASYIKTDEHVELGKRLIILSMFHDKIFEAVALINNSMEFCIHIIMLSCLLHLIVTPYFLLKELFSTGEVFYVMLQLVWLFGHIGRVLIIVEPCQYCINEMTVLSLQLSYCKLRFSSCGFFKINRSLLTSIAGAVTTYLVILFQFKDT